MRRTVRELKQFARDYQKLAAINESYLATAAPPKGCDAALQRLAVGTTCGNNLLLLAKLQWRHKLDDPRPVLRRYAALADCLSAVLGDVGPQDLGRVPFPFPTAVFVLRLLGEAVSDRLLRSLPKGRTINPFFHDRIPDTLLLKALDTGRKPAGWDALVHEQLPAERGDLYARTYGCLMDIILSAARGQDSKALELIEEADQLYLRRQKDMTNFSNSDGGGPFNDLMIDHRLATVIQHGFGNRPEVIARLTTPHQWRWRSAGSGDADE